jgi:hypothetical protein
MRPIEPVSFGTTGPKVTNLQLGLLFLLHHQGPVDPARETLLERFAPELGEHRFGEVTRSLVALYQAQLKNWPNYWPALPKNIAKIVQLIPPNTPGEVDEETAEALNWLVETFRRIKSPSPARGKLRPAVILQKRPSS